MVEESGDGRPFVRRAGLFEQKGMSSGPLQKRVRGAEVCWRTFFHTTGLLETIEVRKLIFSDCRHRISISKTKTRPNVFVGGCSFVSERELRRGASRRGTARVTCRTNTGVESLMIPI